jgi:biopolymer transport protein ExbD
MQVQSEDKPYDDINITPMLDLAYVLLVIFILMCTASVAGTKVNLPKGGPATQNLAKPKTKAISVNNEGKIFLETQPVTLAELEQRLGAMKAAGEFPIVIRGDSLTQYQAVMDVLNVVGGLGLSQVGLATKPAGAK